VERGQVGSLPVLWGQSEGEGNVGTKGS